MANINKIRISGTSYDIQDKNAAKTVTLTQSEYDSLTVKNPNVFYIISDSEYNFDGYWTSAQTNSAITEAVSGKQDTFANESVLSGITSNDITNWNGKSDFSGSYNDLTDKPTIPTVPTSNTAFTNDAGYITSNDISGKTDTSAFTAHTGDSTIHVTSSEKSTWNGKQDTLISGTNIRTVNNQSLLGSGNIDIQGGSTYTAGRGINITNDTISFSLPISADTNNNTIFSNTNNTISKYGNRNLIGGYSNTISYWGTSVNGNNNFVYGYGNQIQYVYSQQTYSENAIFGRGNILSGDSGVDVSYSVIGGYGNYAGKGYTSIFGYSNRATNNFETALGENNVSNTGSTTADKTLFSVGNGTSTSARHNAFEIRQNGDIYLSSGGTDIKLQDHLGGGGTVDQTIISGSTNAVAGGAVYNKIDEVEQVTARALNGLAEADEVTARALIDLHDSLSGKADTSAVTAVQDSLSGYVATSAVTSAVTSGSTSVVTSGGVYQQMGGLKLVKLSQTQYDNLQTKDNMTLYIIVD